MKILYITSRSDMGGGPKHLLELLRSLKSRHKDIIFYVASPLSPPFGEEFKMMAQDFFKIPERSFSMIAFIKLLIFCRKEGIDIVHSHGRGAGMYSRLLGAFSCKVVHTFHGIHNAPGFIGKLKLFIDYLFALLTDKFICVSKEEFKKAKSLRVTDPFNTTVIHNGIVESEIKKAAAMDLREKFNIPPSKKIWGTLARLSREKGIDLFLKTVLENVELRKIYFVIAGSGDDYDLYQDFVKDHNIENIIFMGETSRPLSFLKGLDGYFSYSRGEGLPLSVLEALACGVPCVLSDIGGHYIFRSCVDFFHLQDGNDFALKVLENDRVVECSLFLEQFSMEEMVDKTISLYGEL